MPIRKVKHRSKGIRQTIVLDYKKMLSQENDPVKSLTKRLFKQSGRNNRGIITVRHQGGAHKRLYREIDFKRQKDGIPGTIKTIEYDPNRTSFISLVDYWDGSKAYIITPHGIKVGNDIISGTDSTVDIKIGNATLLNFIPEGTLVHNIEIHPGNGGQIARAAGSFAQILGKDETGRFVILKLASGEMRKIEARCKATIGVVSNLDHSLINLGKAGASRHRGIRPTVRGSVMNPNDHPHGGGEGKQPVGKDAPRTPWGKRHMGVKTRNKKLPSSALIIRRRNAKK